MAGCPFHLGRRGFLTGLAGGAALGLASGGPAEGESLPDARSADPADGTQERLPFYGAHQSGIVTPQPAAVVYAAFDVLAENAEGLGRLLRLLTARIAFLTQGGPAEVADPRMPPPDSGVLGPSVFPDNLSVTVAVGATLFDDRFGLKDAKPRHLQRMTRFRNDALDPAQCHGDLLLSFCANTAETAIHALRDLIKNAPDLMAVRWSVQGFLPPHTLKKQGRDTVRNLLGFKDGTANLDTRDAATMDAHVWVQPGSEGEPGWTAGGSYQVLRTIRMNVERWDRTPLGEQQRIFGRDKHEGAPLGEAGEHDLPRYADDPDGQRIPLDAHIRLANPRTEDTARNLILRRAYNFSRGLTPAGQLDMGLLFGCFQANLAEGFIAVQKRLDGEPLEEYIKPVGGGYFFALPGAAAASDWLGSGMLAGAG